MTLREIACDHLKRHGWHESAKQLSGKWIAFEKEGWSHKYYVNKSRGNYVRKGRTLTSSIAVKLQNGTAGTVIC